MNIAARISLLTVLLVLVTGGAISLLSYQDSREKAEILLHERVRAEVEKKAAVIMQRLSSLSKDVQFLAAVQPEAQTRKESSVNRFGVSGWSRSSSPS